MTRIAVIGAGLSGRLLALNLLRKAFATVSIVLIDRSDARAMGPAYSDEADYLLLNVPAGRMGAFSEDPEHFLKWLKKNGVSTGQWDFLPRRLYREYIFDLTNEAQQAQTKGSGFEFLRTEVVALETGQDGITLHMAGGSSLAADKAVLALGNYPPRHPNIENRKALESERYVRNPWMSGVVDSLAPGDPVFIIGTGQTTVDLIVGLYRRSHTGRIVAISRRGLLPLVHTTFESYPSFFAEIKNSKHMLEILRVVRRHLDRAEAMGIDVRAVIDSLRPDTLSLWLGLPPDEKRRFLRHLFRYWEIIRSRIPPESEEIIETMQASGQLEIAAGRLRDLVDTGETMEVYYARNGGSREEIVRAALVINCIGPESDYGRIDHPLVKNLIGRGLIRPGPAQLGIDALPNGAVIGRDGAASGCLYTLGSTMKGVLWEVLAVPEIRVQAERLSTLLLGAELEQTLDASAAEPASSALNYDGDLLGAAGLADR
jgi:uncharacterized NAD(P)/FAD-binding protein YdhS